MLLASSGEIDVGVCLGGEGGEADAGYWDGFWGSGSGRGLEVGCLDVLRMLMSGLEVRGMGDGLVLGG